MKTTLIVIQNDADHAQAKALIKKLMDSKDPVDFARMTAQACLTEAYHLTRTRDCSNSTNPLTCASLRSTRTYGRSAADRKQSHA
jgi:antitoxin component HigA of HigAB toxin-antitoxin module